MFKDHKNTAVDKYHANAMSSQGFKSRALSFGRNFVDAIFSIVEGKILVIYIEEEEDMDEKLGGY